ncbi:FoF1 ATP synthase subunit gamma, partial [Lichenifustis flavocetrariae]
MTERLAEVGARIDGIRQLGAVVNAMRGIAAARAQQARGQLASVDGYAAAIAAAIGQALTLTPAIRSESPAHRPTGSALVLFCAEQGFAGAFSERLLDAAGPDLGHGKLYLIGTRGGTVARERAITPEWSGAMPSHSDGIPKLAAVIAEALYRRIAAGDVDRLDAMFGRWDPGHGCRVERRRLFPIDLTTLTSPKGNIPFVTLEPTVLIGELTAAYVHAELCKAALHAFAAENEARLQSMTSAHSQIERQLAELQSVQRIVRQDGITE